MSQLKPSFIRDIHEALGQSRFTRDDFEIELPKSGRMLVKITFLHKSNYLLVLNEEEKEDQITVKHNYDFSSRTESVRYKKFVTREIPGRYKTEEQSELNNPGDIINIIPKWCENIRTDLYALAPVVDPLEALRKKLDDDLETIIAEPEQYFSEEEIQLVDSRFDTLFAEISRLQEQFCLTKQQLDSIRKEFEEFKGSARVYPKGVWARITNNKLVKTTGQIINSPEGRKFLFQQLRRALGGGDG